MLKWLKALFEVPKKEETPEAPYKVEVAPVVAAPVSEEVKKPVRKPRAKPAPKPEVQPAAKKPRAKKVVDQPAKTTATKKAPAKTEAFKPKAPRRPKSQA
jgi:hypothetical protein